jgi:Fe-S-cluster containining protein
MNDPDYDPQFYYQCQRCTNCCRWPGDVSVSEAEVDAIAAYLGIGTQEFITQYTRLRTDRRGLSLIDRPDHSCIFLEGRDCVINEVKPQQCRDFPNKWRFPGWRQVCDALPLPKQPDEATSSPA